MDITKWLSETTLPKENSREEAHATTHKSAKRDAHAPKKEHVSRLRRRSPSTDSSIIHVTVRDDTSRHRADRKEERRQRSESSVQPSEPSAQSSGKSESSDDPFRRRPRHKTRHDKYDPHAKERKKTEREKAKELKRKGKKKEKKSCKKKDKVGTGIVHSFHARNVPRERLTLRALDNVGFFKKAKASSPIKNRGLSDLVFTEMKFLQKRKDPPEDAETSKQQTRNKRQKDKTRNPEKEISAYFAPPELPPRDRRTDAPPYAYSEAPRRAAPEVAYSPKRSSSVRPTIELPGRPFLGFGSRGPAPVSSTRLTWSESMRDISAPPDEPLSTSAISVGHLNDWRIPHQPTDPNVHNGFWQRRSLSRRDITSALAGDKGTSVPRSERRERKRRQLSVSNDGNQQQSPVLEPTLGQTASKERKPEPSPVVRQPTPPLKSKGQDQESASRTEKPRATGNERHAADKDSSTFGDLLDECRHAVNRAPSIRSHLDMRGPEQQSFHDMSQRAEEGRHEYVAELHDPRRVRSAEAPALLSNPQALAGDGRLPAMYRTASAATSARTTQMDQNLLEMRSAMYPDSAAFVQGRVDTMGAPYPEYGYDISQELAGDFDEIDAQMWDTVGDANLQFGSPHDGLGVDAGYALIDRDGDLEYDEESPDAPLNFWRPRRLY